MEKFFKKHDLIKVSGIMVLLTVLLTWLIPYGYFSGSEMVVQDITRVGLTSFFQYGLLGVYYFTVLVTFLLVLGGFYQVLGKTLGYQKLVKNVSSKLKGKEVIAVLVSMFVFAALTSVSNEYFPLLVFVPFVVTVLSRIKVDKISAFCATFGGLLVGTIGGTYGGKVVGFINTTLGTTVKTFIGAKIALFVLAYVCLAVFTARRVKHVAKSADETYDKFEVADPGRKSAKVWPYIVGGCLIFVATVLAYLPWDTFKVTAFESATTWVNELSIAGVPIISYICGEFVAFGSWDIFTIQFVLLFATLLIHWFGRVKFDDVVDSFGEGFAKMAPVVIVLLFVYLILEFAVMFPVVPVIVDWFATISEKFNVVWNSIAIFITSLFGVGMQYVMSLSGTYYAAMFAGSTKVLAIIYQAMFGLVSFFAPSSAILMIGLSYLGIPYKDWMKYIWKFLVAMLLVIIIVLIIVA